jgi:hypothetical protein
MRAPTAFHSAYMVVFLASVAVTNTAHAQRYSSDLDDVKRFYSSGSFQHIGDEGQVEKIIDFRGYVPLSAVSKKRDTLFTLDIFQYYKFPLRSTLRQVYHGLKELEPYFDVNVPEDYDKVTEYFGDVPIVKEEDLAPKEGEFNFVTEDTAWVDFANNITDGESGEELYRGVFRGGGGFETAQPIAILMNKSNIFVLINLRLSSINRNGTGQTLIALEFSRASKKYRDFHVIYTTSEEIATNASLLRTTSFFVNAAVKRYVGDVLR